MGPLPGGTSFPEDVAPFLGKGSSKSGARKGDLVCIDGSIESAGFLELRMGASKHYRPGCPT